MLHAVVVRLKRDACKGDSEVAMVTKIEGSKADYVDRFYDRLEWWRVEGSRLRSELTKGCILNPLAP